MPSGGYRPGAGRKPMPKDPASGPENSVAKMKRLKIDPIDILTSLKAKHDAGEKWAGVDVMSGEIVDSWIKGVIEPLKIKTQAVKSASEVAELILRIDDVIAGSGMAKKDHSGMPQGMPGMM